MGFKDILSVIMGSPESSDKGATGMELAANTLDLGSNGLALATAFMDEDSEHAANMGIAAGGMSALSGLMGIASARRQIGKANDKGERMSGWMGGINSFIGIGGGIADMVSGIGNKKGDKKMEERASYASGALGILGSLGGLIKGGYDVYRAKKELSGLSKKENLTEDEKARVAELESNKNAAWKDIATSAAGGIGSSLGIVGTKTGNNKWSQAGAVIGNGAGLLSSGVGIFSNIKDLKEPTSP